MIGHRTRFRENDDLPPWRGPAAKKKPPFFNVCALIRRGITLKGLRQIRHVRVTLCFCFNTSSRAKPVISWKVSLI